MLHVQESVNLTIYLYAQTMGHRRMLYIRKFYVVKNTYIFTRAGGGGLAYDVIISTQGFIYAQTMGKPRMLYIRKFYVVQNKYINLLAVGVALRATPTPSWWGASRPPKPHRARKSLRAIAVVSLCTTYEYR